MKKYRGWTVGAVAVLAGLLPLASVAKVVEVGNEAPWSLSLSAGEINFDGSEVVKPGFISAVHLSYDFNQRWTIEGVGYLAPDLKANRIEIGDNTGQFRPGLPDSSTYLLGGAIDGLWHFTRWQRVDPYLVGGLGVFHFGDNPASGARDDQDSVAYRMGAGVMYHFNDEWALRADWRGMLVGSHSQGQSILTAGLTWTLGAHVPPQIRVVGGPLDSDGDGLTDAEEAVLGTNPHDPDTDHDGLTDFEEVKAYHTDPLNPDSDYDMLKDGDEVHVYKTDPLDPDTDKGGVTDGHEVLEDFTNPLNPADDLIKFELYLNFDYDKDIIKSQYFPDLDVIGKTLQRDPGATARIEGHADKLKKSVKKYNDELSLRRARSVLNYLADKAKILRSRMSAIGYGFSRPKARNDPVNGNPVNRRVDVYIRPSGRVANTNVTVTVNFPIVPAVKPSPQTVPAASEPAAEKAPAVKAPADK